MKIATYNAWSLTIRIIVCALVALSVILANWIIAVVAVSAAIAVFITLRLNVKGIVEDERSGAVAQKATSFGYSWGTFGMTIAGMVFVFTNRNDLSGTPALIGFVLFFTAFAIMLIRDLAYFFYGRKFSGKE